MANISVEQLRNLGTTKHSISLCGEGAMKAGRVIDGLQIACREAANEIDDKNAAIAELVEALLSSAASMNDAQLLLDQHDYPSVASDLRDDIHAAQALIAKHKGEAK